LPSIPTNTSELVNDSGYLACDDLDGCQTIIDIKQSIIDIPSVQLIEKTYSELNTMITNLELVPGQLYLMTDFQTIYDQPDYSDANTPKTTVVTKTASVAPIILLAISETE